ncbi:CocE/NonD family hydrolase [Aminobacter carboxidus]|uniref:CocE/NonD family hydrolase n=1 Tax=Aminobacter carboxidus TaxID=376165 RepID=A0ABR9GJZ3_9HYPH|nr:CocE/NonD family hydrolase [Aminobacter carboxidus]MBE1203990.1 CocE/NonD family hydrolase [Aminobacter carboxidus]
MKAVAETMGVASLPALEPVSPGVMVHRDVMVAMRDGVRLAADIYRPANDGRVLEDALPVIVERTAYGKDERSRSEIELGMTRPMTRAEVASHFVGHGYIVIYQDCRGRHGSEGAFTKYLAEGPDGYDTLAWIVEQPWSNGKIGTMGLSYAAHTQMALACLNPPGLAAMVMDSGGFSNAFTCGIRQGGAFELKQATWAYNNARESTAAKHDPNLLRALEAEDVKSWFNAMPWSEGRSPVRWVPEYEDYLLEQWRHGTFDDYWKQPGIYAAESYDTFPNVPVALLSSWYDAYVKTTFENYEGLARDRDRPMALIMGPNLHGNRNATFAGDVEFGAAAPLGGNVSESWLEFRRRWFDRWMKNADNDVDKEPRARLFVMGGGSGRKTPQGRLDHGGRWIAAPDWPVPTAEETVLHLHEDGRLSTEAPARTAAPFVYDFDPKHPVPTIGGALTSGQPVFEGGGFDQREQARFFGCDNTNLPLSARLDVLSFETEPFAEDIAVVGPVIVELFASTDGPDTDFTAKLIDVYPPSEDYPTGFAMILTDGIFRCRYRDGFDAPKPCVPGEVMSITIEPFATANLFKKGHRLRLDISSSNFPKFDVNPNTGAPEGRGRAKRVARNMVYCDQERASRIRLRTLSAAALQDISRVSD